MDTFKRQPQRAQTTREPSKTKKNVDFVNINSHGVKNVQLRRSPSISTLDEQKQRTEIEMPRAYYKYSKFHEQMQIETTSRCVLKMAYLNK